MQESEKLPWYFPRQKNEKYLKEVAERAERYKALMSENPAAAILKREFGNKHKK